jgi:hypothetical protein
VPQRAWVYWAPEPELPQVPEGTDIDPYAIARYFIQQIDFQLF